MKKRIIKINDRYRAYINILGILVPISRKYIYIEDLKGYYDIN